jgi:hypothetical protein
MKLAASAFAACLVAGAVQAAPLRDPATGLTVDPPPGYVATAEAPARPQAASVSVKQPGEGGTGCQIGFTPVAGNARRSQSQINATVSSPEGQQAGIDKLAAVYNVTEAGTVQLGGITALVMHAGFKPHPKLPADAQRIRTFFAILETPRGSTNIACAAEAATFSTRLPGFEAVVRGTTAP